MADVRRVTRDFAVAPQLSPPDFEALARAGFTAVINNRPDGEAPDQLSDADARAAAEQAGLVYAYLPIAGPPPPAQADALTALLRAQTGPVLAYCRSGTRSITLWALAQARSGAAAPDEIVKLAADAGYDLSGLRPALGAGS